MNLQQDFQVFRRGIANFVGFNADDVTGWSTHVARCAAAGQETDAISDTVAELEKQRAELDEILAKLNSQETAAISDAVAELEKQRAVIDEILSKLNSPEKAALGDTVTDLEIQRAFFDGRTAQMNTKKENIIKDLPKFPKPISYSDANMLKNAVPNTTAQEQIMTLFHNKQYPA